jgi:hypothetical protein
MKNNYFILFSRCISDTTGAFVSEINLAVKIETTLDGIYYERKLEAPFCKYAIKNRPLLSEYEVSQTGIHFTFFPYYPTYIFNSLYSFNFFFHIPFFPPSPINDIDSYPPLREPKLRYLC